MQAFKNESETEIKRYIYTVLRQGLLTVRYKSTVLQDRLI